ncbi:MAG: Lon protease, partial [Alphaproteobacteria bacterium MarineAlpha5_Bin8]
MSINKVPVLPLRDIVVFPHMVAPLFVGRKLSINALNYVMAGDKKIVLITQKNAEIDNPIPNDLFSFGTVAKILQLLKLPDGTIKVLVEGLERIKVNQFHEESDFLSANITSLKISNKNNSKIKALIKIVVEQFESYHKINKKIPLEVLNSIRNISDANKIADLITSNLNIGLKQKQEILEISSTEKRLDKIYSYLISEVDTMQVERKIKGRVKRQMEKTQKEYYLNEQIKAIQKELGDSDDIDDIAEIEKKIKSVNLTNEASEKAKTELKKLKNMSPMSAE